MKLKNLLTKIYIGVLKKQQFVLMLFAKFSLKTSTSSIGVVSIN